MVWTMQMTTVSRRSRRLQQLRLLPRLPRLPLPAVALLQLRPLPRLRPLPPLRHRQLRRLRWQTGVTTTACKSLLPRPRHLRLPRRLKWLSRLPLQLQATLV